MHFEKAVTIGAPPETVWQVLLDVESWPELTESMTSVSLLTPAPLAVGSRARIKQPRFPAAEWVVTELVAATRFVWEATAPGVRTTATHEVVQGHDDTSTLRLQVEQSGPLGRVIGQLSGRLTRRYLDLEGAGIKRRAEGLS